MKIIHCRTELDPSIGGLRYRALRILQADEEDLESTLWAVCVGSGGTKIKARRINESCS